MCGCDIVCVVVYIQELDVEHLKKKELTIIKHLEDRDHARKLAAERRKAGKR